MVSVARVAVDGVGGFVVAHRGFEGYAELFHPPPDRYAGDPEAAGHFGFVPAAVHEGFEEFMPQRRGLPVAAGGKLEARGQ